MKTPRRTTHILGEWVEMYFQMRCSQLGYYVAKPWSEKCPYDFLVDAGPRPVRVQVKSTRRRVASGAYVCPVKRGPNHDEPYKRHEVDFFAVYLTGRDVWYVIPFEAMRGRTTCFLNPEKQECGYSKFVEAWELFLVPR